ncbi:BN159_2729 family protein [Streptomyces sp. NPDC059015]|uniref:BN159_2729 family protein n=1 Tax=unclassified Streptomyces TaxID=2593676 RepID=UPI0036BFFB42
MNKNLPQTIQTIRESVGLTEPEASRLAHELNRSGLLVDPERSYGVVLGRRPEGGWARVPKTELELQAAAWDASCRRAAALADTVRAECPPESGLLSVEADGDRVRAVVHVTAADQWGQWRRYLGITTEETQPLEYAYVGSGHRDGVAVSVVAYDAPEIEARTAAAAAMPFQHGGTVYDLALPLRDAQGEVWDHAGQNNDGMPLLRMRGGAERCSLANVVEYVGPLTAVCDDQPVPGVRETVAAAAEGGESA